MNYKQFNRHLFSTVFSIFLFAVTMSAQGTAFSFQGRLNDGANPANGSYDLQFRLFNSITGGSPIGTVAERPNTTLINGVFSVTLDFGATAFNSPSSIFIEIGVKPAGSPNAFTILGPRQQLTVVPFAVRAANATSALTANFADFAGSAEVAGNSNFLGGLQASSYALKTGTEFVRNQTTIQPETNFNISGNGTINGNLNVQGNNTSGGNVAQNRDKGDDLCQFRRNRSALLQRHHGSEYRKLRLRSNAVPNRILLDQFQFSDE